MKWTLLVLLAVAFTSTPALAKPWPGGSQTDSVRFLILADEHVLAASSARRLAAGVEDDPGASNAQRVEALLLWTEACIGMRPELESERDAALDRLREAEEIAELDFRGLRTVVLSACESGLGVGDSGEGVLGIRRAFHLAGAQSVVASLWPVRDDAARRWMRVFHARYFSGEEDVADAAREATRSMIAAARADGRVVDPLGVGGFVVTSRGVPR